MTKRLCLIPAVSTGLMFGADASAGPSYTKDIAPILRDRCQNCHRPGEVGPMPLLTYSQTRPWAKAIRTAVLTRKMPPWFADSKLTHFRNDASLSQKEIDSIAAWVDAGAPEGDPRDLPKQKQFESGWNIGNPDAIVEMPNAYQIPAKGTIDITYILIPSGFTEDKWVQAAEVRPGD